MIHVAVEADVAVTCQRCLESTSIHLNSENSLAAVWTDEQAAHLPRYLDPLIVADEASSLWELVEDELILAMPPFSYHDTEDCRESIAGFSAPVPDQAAKEETPNPITMLAQ